MRISFVIFLLIFITKSLFGQENKGFESGKVSYISSKNVYVKFESTENIEIGDTLYIEKGEQMIPFLVVSNKSSITSICFPLTEELPEISAAVYALRNSDKNGKVISTSPLDQKLTKSTFGADSNILPSDEHEEAYIVESRKKVDKNQQENFKQQINGRLSAASYLNFSDVKNYHRMRYAVSFRGNNLGNSRFSFENYITFRHTIGQWQDVKDNLNNALKVYSFDVKYDFNRTTSVVLGRRINPKLANIGAIDGIQFEKGIGNFLFGSFLGSRPDYQDYGLNTDLFQYGVYFGHSTGNRNGRQQSTISFIDQRNNSKIDRRLIYLQHTNALMKDLTLFSSAEINLYEYIDNKASNVFDLTSLYVLLRYRFTRKLNASVSYDSRKNVIFYESYKSFIENLIEAEARQGARLNVTYRLFSNVNLGVNTGLRFQGNNTNQSKNLNGYLTFSRISPLNVGVSVTANLLQTGYLDSRILGIRVTKDLLRGKLNGDLNFRMVDYSYRNYEQTTHQNIAGINFSYKINRKFSLYLYYEGIFDSQKITYNRINTKLIKRF